MSTDADNVIRLHPDREPAETHSEVELDEPADGPEQPVDALPLARPPVELRPILPSSWRKGNRKPAAARSWRRVKHSIAYHAVHFFIEYLWKWLWFGCRGFVKLADQIINEYWMLRDASHLKKEAKRAGDQLGWESAHKRQVDARKERTPKVLGGAAIIIAAWTWAWIYGGPLAIVPGVIVVWSAFAQYYAHDKGTSILSAAVISHRERRMNAEIIVRAFAVAALCRTDTSHVRSGFITGSGNGGTD